MRQILTALIGVLVTLQGRAQGSLTLSGGAVMKTSTAAYVTLTDMSITNNGAIEHTANSGGSLRLTGASNISMSGSGNTNLYRLVVDKAPGTLIELQNNLNISSEIYFNGGGSINLNNSIIDLGTAGNVWNETANTSIYSTGTGYIQAAGVVSSPSEKNLGRLGAVITSSSDLGYTLVRRGHTVQTSIPGIYRSIRRNYSIIPINNSNLHATLRFYYLDSELNNLPEGSLELWQQDNMTWNNLGKTAQHTGYNYVEKTGISHLSTFTLSATVTVAPSITCPGAITISNDPGECGGTLAGVSGVTATGSPAVTITYKANNQVITFPYTFPRGTTTVTAVASNGVAPDATCSFTVTVNLANGFNPPPAQTIPLGTNCSITVPDLISGFGAKNNCGGLRFVQTPAAGTILTSSHNSTHMVSITAIDEAENKISEQVMLTVKDVTPPVITAPATVKWINDPGQCGSAYVPLGTPAYSDNCVVQVTNNRPEMFPIGTTIVTWTVTDAAGLKATANQTVVVDDTEWPRFRYTPPDVSFPYSSGGTYSINNAVALDNCGTVSVAYTITGATNRSGTGSDASGSFNPGTSTITWSATDASGNREAFPAKTIVSIALPDPAVIVTIPDAWAVKPGGQPNTLYIGYGPSAINLVTQVSGGQAPYTYQWSTGATSQDVALAFLQTGVYTVSVTVTDATGATATTSKTVTVTDVRCGKNNDKVEICSPSGKRYRPNCVTHKEVATLLAAGSTLGSCPAASSSYENAGTETAAAFFEPQPLALSVAPNPSIHYFRITVHALSSEPVMIQVMDSYGRIIETKTNILPGATLQVGHLYRPGFYIIRLTQGKQQVSTKLIKQ